MLLWKKTKRQRESIVGVEMRRDFRDLCDDNWAVGGMWKAFLEKEF